MNPAMLGFVRGLGVAVLAAVLVFMGDVANLSGVLRPEVAAIVSALALSLEEFLANKKGRALFGAVSVQN